MTTRQDVPENMRRLAYEELLIAEGSDWNWWYGPEHQSENRPDFDQLYRDHLSNVYRALGAAPPEALSHSLPKSLALESQAGEFRQPPSNPIHATIDGKVTSAFEWFGAGEYRPDRRSGAMHGGEPPIREMFYGTDGENVYVRLDADRNATFGVEFEGGKPVKAQVAVGPIVELSAPRAGQ